VLYTEIQGVKRNAIHLKVNNDTLMVRRRIFPLDEEKKLSESL